MILTLSLVFVFIVSYLLIFSKPASEFFYIENHTEQNKSDSNILKNDTFSDFDFKTLLMPDELYISHNQSETNK